MSYGYEKPSGFDHDERASWWRDSDRLTDKLENALYDYFDHHLSWSDGARDKVRHAMFTVLDLAELIVDDESYIDWGLTNHGE